MSQPVQESNLTHLAQWTVQLRKQVKGLLATLGAASKSAGWESAKARDERLGQLGQQVRAWRAAIGPLIGSMRAARAQRRVQASAKRAGVLEELSGRVRQVRREAREALKAFDAALGSAATEARSMRDQEIASIFLSVRCLRAQLRRFLADAHDWQGRQNSAARGLRAGFVKTLKLAGPGAQARPKPSASAGAKRPAARQPRSAAHRPGFAQNILGLMQRRKIA